MTRRLLPGHSSPAFVARALLALLLFGMGPVHHAQKHANRKLIPSRGARVPIQVDGNGTGDPQGVAIASSGDLTAVLFEDDDTQEVFVAAADGRALAFAAPLRIDSDTLGADKVTGDTLLEHPHRSLQVAGDSIYATWLDERNASPGGSGGLESRDLYFACSKDRGVTWTLDAALDKGYPVGGDNAVLSWVLEVVPGTSDDQLIVLQLVDHRYYSKAERELYLNLSADGGQSFAPAQRIAPSFYDVNELALAVDGQNIHVAFTAQATFGSPYLFDVYYTGSTDGGVSFSTPVQLDNSTGTLEDLAKYEISIDAADSVVAVAWRASADISSPYTDLHAAVSSDGGASFGPDQVVGDYAPDSVRVADSTLAIQAGTVVLVWEDDRSGGNLSTDVYATTSSDAGVNWSLDQRLNRSPGSNRPKLVKSTNGSDLAVHWWNRGNPIPVGSLSLAGNFTRDLGASWLASEIYVSGAFDLALSNNQDIPDIAYNELYGNIVHAWTALDANGAKHVFAGGYRPQQLIPTAFEAGGEGHVDLTDFSGADDFGWVFFSSSMGSLPLGFGDGRDLGIGFDTLFLLTLTDPATFSVSFNGTSAARTGEIPVTLSTGTKLFAVGLSYSLAGGLRIGEITDLATILIQ